MDDPRKSRRAGTHVGDRNEDRRRTPAAGSYAIPEPVADEDCTGKYEGDELREARGKRPTLKRVEHLEERADELGKDLKAQTAAVSELAAEVAGLTGEMKILPDLVEALKEAARNANERANVTLTAQVGVGTAQAMAPLEARKTKLGWVTSLIAIVGTTVAGVLALVQMGRC